MYSLANISKVPLGIWALLGLMLATRFNHFGSAISLPDASLAVFFMAGLWFGRLPLFIVLLFQAALIDYISISQFGVNDYCISPAYGFLIPTYAALFFSGRIAARFNTLETTDLMLQVALLIGATSIAFLISNSSFYLLSGKFSELTWIQYGSRVIQYYTPYLTSTLIYSIVIIGMVKLLIESGFFDQQTNKSV